MGIDPGETPYEVRPTRFPMRPVSHGGPQAWVAPAGPGQAYWKPVAYAIETEADARKAVQELAAKKVD
jgi:hypothetical protein